MRPIGVTLICLWSLPAFAQTVPDAVLYRFYFGRVNALERAAENLKTKGQDDARARQLVKQETGLTESEASLIKQTAQIFQSDVQQFDSDVATPSIEAAKADVTRGTQTKERATESLKALDARRDKITTDYITQLHASLGDERFKKLDDFVRHNIAPKIKVVDPKQPNAPPARPAPPNPAQIDPSQINLKKPTKQ